MVPAARLRVLRFLGPLPVLLRWRRRALVDVRRLVRAGYGRSGRRVSLLLEESVRAHVGDLVDMVLCSVICV
jgi:hypothetical protein